VGVCLLSGVGLSSDNIFKLESPGNRDDCYQPYHLLSRKFLTYGYEIHTIDHHTSSPEFYIHMDVTSDRKSIPCYLLLLEAPTIQPANREIPDYYRKVFTWRDDLVDNNRYIKLNLPNLINTPKVDGFKGRDLFCSVIAGNKSVPINDHRELYSERVRAIRWFESNAPEDFYLYGVDWDCPPARTGLLGKVEMRIWRELTRVASLRPFPSYQGRVDRKYDVLSHTRFSLCYENTRDLQGYITEKIFDCFSAGCVPVYWGAINITEHIPSTCFIDRRNFEDTADLYCYLRSIDERTFESYQEEIIEFLNSPAAKPFSSEVFAETIVNTIVQDLDSLR